MGPPCDLEGGGSRVVCETHRRCYIEEAHCIKVCVCLIFMFHVGPSIAGDLLPHLWTKRGKNG